MANPNPKNQFVKGKSGNPDGRPPKGYSITEWFKQMLHSKPEVKDAIGRSILKKALEGDTAAQKMVWQYMDGLPLQKNEILGEGGGALKVIVTSEINGPDSKAPDLELS